MNALRSFTVPACLGAAALMTLPSLASAGTTGHVGAFSEYVFRGVVADGGAAVQGGIDHLNDNGLLAGLWATNANKFGGSELDLYAGYLLKLSDKVMVDVGGLYYFLTEDEEQAILDFDGDGIAEREDLDTLEIFATVFAGPIKAQVYWSPDYLATDEDAFYYTAIYTHAVNSTINVAVQAGYTDGDGAEFIYGDDYFDYSITLSKTIREGLVFSLALIDTNLKDEYVFAGTSDDPKVVVGVKQTFAF